MNRKLLTQEEYDEITTLEQALVYLRRFVRRPAGRRPEGERALTDVEKNRSYRARKRGNNNQSTETTI